MLLPWLHKSAEEAMGSMVTKLLILVTVTKMPGNAKTTLLKWCNSENVSNEKRQELRKELGGLNFRQKTNSNARGVRQGCD